SKESGMEHRENAYIHWINLVLAIILFASPWVLGFPAGVASINAMIAGLVIGVLAIGALVAFAPWEEWINLVLGLWTFISPWILGFGPATGATWIHVMPGLAVAILAGVELWLTSGTPPARTVSS